MLGAIIWDIVGSIYEFNNIKTKDFELYKNQSHFTDDTVTTIAIGNTLLKCNGEYSDLYDIAYMAKNKLDVFLKRILGDFEKLYNTPATDKITLL